MIAQVKEQLRQDGRLMENTQTVFKVVRINDAGEYRPTTSKDEPLVGKNRIVYIPNQHYKVDDNFEYPAFAFHDEVNAREFIYMRTIVDSSHLATLSCVAYQWAWLNRYMHIYWLGIGIELEHFWSTDMPFRQPNSYAEGTHFAPSGTIGLFEFEIGDVIYEG